MPPVPARPDEAAVRRRILLSVIGCGVLVCGGTVCGGFRLFERIVDYRPAAAELPEAVKAYRATGLPWVATDLAPKPPMRPEENAAPLILAAIETAAGTKTRLNSDDLALRDASRAEEWEEVERLLRPRQAALKIFEQAAKRPRADFKRDLDLGPNILFPEFAEIKAATKLFGYRSQLRAARGDRAGSRSDLRTALALARLAESDVILISMLVRISCEAISYDAAQRAAAIDPGLAAPFLDELARPFPEADFARSLRGEAYMAVVIGRNLHGRMTLADATGLSGGGRIDRGLSMEMDSKKVARDGLPEGTTARAYMARALQVWTRAGAEMRRHAKDPAALGNAMDVISEGEQKKLGASYLLNKIMMPVFAQAGTAVARTRAGREITLAYLRALDHRRRTGSFPKVLVSGNDPFGRPYVARREGAGFRIYCIGPNGRDDGGLTSAERKKKFVKGDDVAAVFPPTVGERSSSASRKANQVP